MTQKDKFAAASDTPALAALETTPGIVGIGASAGGLEALEAFFGAVPARSGLAFVVVQHLDPDKKSAMVELLQRSCALPVAEAVDGQKVEPDHCYICPPGLEVSLFGGRLQLLKPTTARGLGLPIDVLLRSLAAERHGRAAAVILSGMGSDGTLGARVLKESAGAVFVQSPESAGFGSMPQSVIDAGVADVVAPAAELPARIIGYFALSLLQAGFAEGVPAEPQAALDKVLMLVRTQTGHDFSLYKKGTVYRRIQRRMAIHQLGSVDDYVDYVHENAFETELLYKEMLIGVTSFFRDPEVWEDLRTQIAADLRERRPRGGALRAWVAACSSGEEAYTLAMIFLEAAAELDNPAAYSLQIFATDLEKDAVAKARHGVYPQGIAADVTPRRLARFFTPVNGGYRVNTEVRAMIVFAQQSIASDPPFARLDILTCRNLLIYLEVELQKKLLPLFHHGLNPGGLLLLGSAETAGQSSDLFVPLSVKARIYRRLELAGRSSGAGFPPYGGAPPYVPTQAFLPPKTQPGGPSLQTLADQVLARRYAPSSVLVTTQGDIVYFSGKSGKYLEPAAGKANLNLFAMARAGLSHTLAEAFYRAIRQNAPETTDETRFEFEGKEHVCTMAIDPLDQPEALRGLVMVVFQYVETPSPAPLRPAGSTGALDERVQQLGEELARSREENQSTREEMQISQENLLSANEELQSANEELTTSREEMQSINEELQTVNAELQIRVDALARASDDMENLLNSTDIATLFLDQNLNVRRFTTRATGLIKLIPADAGRPITDIVSDMDYPELAGDARAVLRTLMFQEKEVRASGERWFMVRIMPYRTQDNRIDGVVITFSDISNAKLLEASLRKTRGA